MGRQPWIVSGLMPTRPASRRSSALAEVVITLIGFTLLYGVLGVVEVGLLLTPGRGRAPGAPTPTPASHGDERAPRSAFAY